MYRDTNVIPIQQFSEPCNIQLTFRVDDLYFLASFVSCSFCFKLTLSNFKGRKYRNLIKL